MITKDSQYEAILKNKPRNYRKIVAIIIILILFFWSLHGVKYVGIEEKGSEIVKNIILGILTPSTDLIFSFANDSVLYLIIETTMIAFLGTFIGAIIAIFFAILGSNNLTPPYIHKPIRIILSILRTIPALILGIMVIKMTGSGPFAGVVTFSILSIGMIAKLYIEDIEEINKGLSEVAQVGGLNWLQTVRCVVIPQVFNSIISIYIYRFEINVRDASTLGLIGAGGIGFPLINSINIYSWHNVGAYLLGLILLVLLVEYFSTKIRYKLTRG